MKEEIKKICCSFGYPNVKINLTNNHSKMGMCIPNNNEIRISIPTFKYNDNKGKKSRGILLDALSVIRKLK